MIFCIMMDFIQSFSYLPMVVHRKVLWEVVATAAHLSFQHHGGSLQVRRLLYLQRIQSNVQKIHPTDRCPGSKHVTQWLLENRQDTVGDVYRRAEGGGGGGGRFVTSCC